MRCRCATPQPTHSTIVQRRQWREYALTCSSCRQEVTGATMREWEDRYELPGDYLKQADAGTLELRPRELLVVA